MSTSPPTFATPLPTLRTSKLALFSLISSICGCCTCGIGGLVGVALGIAGLIKINNPANALSGRGLAIAGIIVGALNFVVVPFQVGLLLPGLARARMEARGLKASHQLKIIDQSMRSYAAATNRWPAAATWDQDLIQGNYVTAELLAYPGFEDEGRAFAMNQNLDGIAPESVTDPSTTVLLFECEPGSPPAGTADLLPKRSRNRRSCLVLYVDGHIEEVPDDRLVDLMWKP
jgi:hypothetical protein